MLASVCLAIGHTAVATECFDYTQVPNVRDRLIGDGAVLVSGGYAYNAHLSRLLVHDLTTTPHATQIAELDLQFGSIQSIAKAGNTLYLAARDGIAVVLIEDPLRPVALPSPVGAGMPGHLAVDGALLYVETRRASTPFYHFQVFDISSPGNPTPLGQTTLPFAGAGFAISNGHAYVAMTNGGLQVIDVSNPNAPVKRGSFNTLGMHARDVAVRGDLAYVTSSEGGFGLYVLDVSDPGQPTFVTGLSLDAGGWGIQLDGDTAYIAGGAADGVAVVDIAAPSAPRLLETVVVRSFSTNVEVADGGVFVGASNGVFRVSAANTDAPPLVGVVATPGEASFVARAGLWALVMDGEAGVQVIDVANPAAPALVGSVDTPGYASRAAVSGSHAFLAVGERGPGGLVAVDFSTPSSPRLVDNLDTTDPAIDVVVDGDYACVAAGSQMHVVDISRPDSMVVVGSVNLRSGGVGVTLHGDHAYVAELSAGVSIVDVSDPGVPRLVGQIPDADNAVRVQAVDGRLYVANFASPGPDLIIMDLADPVMPTRLGSLELYTSAFLHFAVDGNLLYTSDGLHVVDISEPHAPLPVAGTVHLPGHPTAVAVDAEYLYLATEIGLEIRAKQCDASTSVDVAGFEAVVEPEGVRLSWTTPAATFDAFDVLRQAHDGHKVRAFVRLPHGARHDASGTRWNFVDVTAEPGRTYRYKIRGTRADGRHQVFGPVEVNVHGWVGRFALRPIQPNPSANSALLHFELPRPARVELEVFDVAGRRVQRLYRGTAGAGLHVRRWDGHFADGRPAPNGVYFVRYVWERGSTTRRLTLLR